MPVCQYQTVFILDDKAPATKSEQKSIKQTSNAQSSWDVIAQSKINGALENWVGMKLYIKICPKLNHAHIVKWAQAGTGGLEGAVRSWEWGGGVRLHSDSAKHQWWLWSDDTAPCHTISLFSDCPVLSQSACCKQNWVPRKLQGPLVVLQSITSITLWQHSFLNYFMYF